MGEVLHPAISGCSFSCPFLIFQIPFFPLRLYLSFSLLKASVWFSYAARLLLKKKKPLSPFSTVLSPYLSLCLSSSRSLGCCCNALHPSLECPSPTPHQCDKGGSRRAGKRGGHVQPSGVYPSTDSTAPPPPLLVPRPSGPCNRVPSAPSTLCSDPAMPCFM